MRFNSITKWKAKNSCLFLCLILSMSYSSAQNIEVNGIVTGDGETLIGATVLIKGSSSGTTTDFDGAYSISVPPDAILSFSYTGFTSVDAPVDNRTTIDVVLATQSSLLDEIVVVGYGTQRKKEVTGAVVKVEAATILKTATADLGDALQGNVAGVNVQASSGRPGDGSNIQIRGLGSINAGALGPLYVVDGIPYDRDPNISPDQIKSIDILKDGAAASIYGTRASNGVILITTKKGVVGEMKVDFSMYAGVQNITSGTPLMNAQEQMYAEEVRLNALGRDPLIFFFNPDALDYDSDFVGDVQNNNAGMQNYSLGVSGGVKNLTLSFNSNYFNQNGILINSGFDRLTNRVSGEFTKGKFKAFATVNFTEEHREQEPFALYEYGIVQAPWQPSLNQITAIGESGVQIPVRNEIQYSFLSRQLDNIDKRKVNSSNIALNLQYEILEGLKYKVNIGRNSWDYQREFFQPQYLVYRTDGTYNPTASRPQAILNENFIFSHKEALENVLTYDKAFGLHKLNFLGVVSYERFNSKNVGTGVIYSETANNDIVNLGAGSDGIKPTSQDERRTLSGKLFRAQYNFNDKYLVSGSIRRDGSSKFSESNRYGNFLGFSAGWNITSEDFFNFEKIDALKLRISAAEVGNQDIPSYAFAPIIETGVNYPFGPNEGLSFGSIQRTYVNSNIKWETTQSKNIGIDLTMLDYRLNFTADVYINEKKDMLLSERLPPSTGTHQPRAQDFYSVKITNAGNMVNKGIELALNYQDRTTWGMKYKLTSTFTKNVNEVTDLNGIDRGFANARPITSQGPNIDYTTFLATGYEAGAFFLIQNDGVIKTDEELQIYKETLDPSAQLGDIKYIDENEDGMINDLDRVYSGSGQPEFEAGLGLSMEYRNFDFFVQGYFSYGAEIYNGSKLYAYAVGRHKDLYYQWSPQNAESDIPADRQNAFHNNVRARSDLFLEDGTYLRIRNINLGYSIPGLDRIGMDNLRIYVSAMNPFTFTNYEGYDPEVGGDGLFLRGVDRGNYPVSRRFIGGIQASF